MVFLKETEQEYRKVKDKGAVTAIRLRMAKGQLEAAQALATTREWQVEAAQALATNRELENLRLRGQPAALQDCSIPELQDLLEVRSICMSAA